MKHTFKLWLDENNKIVFYDNDNKIVINELIFPDNGNNVKIDYDRVEGRLSNFQLKKKITRTLNKLLRRIIAEHKDYLDK